MTKKELAILDRYRQNVLKEGRLRDIKQMLSLIEKHYPNDNLAIVEKRKDEIIEYTIKRTLHDIRALGTALVNMGLKGKHIAICGENSYAWLISFLAIICGVGIAVPIDKELTDDGISQLISKADCEVVFCSKTYVKCMKAHQKNDERCKTVICFNKEVDAPGFYTFQNLIDEGDKLLKDGDTSYTDIEIDSNAMTAIFFTSGTTGANKGVMLSHKNLCTNVNGITDLIPSEGSSFSLLPMNHVFELSCNCLTAMYMNATIYINDSLKNILANIQLFKPHALNAVPLVLEGIYYGIWAEAERKGKADALRKLVSLSNKLREKGIDMRPVLFSTIKKKFGNKFPTLACGGAASRAEYVKGLGDFGFKVYNGYGLTESSPTVTLNMEADRDPTSAGYVFPKTSIRINEPDEEGVGEIWIKGDNVFQGYYKDPEATAASFEDGWFKTGDFGKLTASNELFISGRKKSLIILDNGKNVFPEDIEFGLMDNISYVHEAVALESEQVINGHNTKIIASVLYVEPSDFPDKTDDEILKIVKTDVADVNRKMPSYKKVTDVVLTYTEFDKSSTRKIIRAKAAERYFNSKEG